MGLETLIFRLQGQSVTPVTADKLPDVTAKPAQIGACTSVTPVTAQNDVTASKPQKTSDRQREARWQKVIAMLEAAPDTLRAIYTDADSDPVNVILCVAVRHPTGATCEMTIPKDKYDPWRLMELIERHGQATH